MVSIISSRHDSRRTVKSTLINFFVILFLIVFLIVVFTMQGQKSTSETDSVLTKGIYGKVE